MALTHRELCQIAYRFLKRNGFKVCFHDRFIAVTSTGEQPDAMGFRNSASCLIEAKCSRADLLADRKKRFRKNPSLGMGDWRFFISEPGIISIEDLPPGWGLLHVVNGRVRKVHGWPKGNCCWGNPDDKPFDWMLSVAKRETRLADDVRLLRQEERERRKNIEKLIQIERNAKARIRRATKSRTE
ncbi:hypothetical protein C0X79_003113 [Escherichia coli O5]|nr:hypothetical protein [Escherichia coli]EFB4119957.1 hypothetical protein [Escherichia coli O5]HAI8361249.1 hypothetical protein [Escherichia coli]HAI8518344.1 hypothetical protein [Escherichia coli]